jgi:glycosyltransferase involved in cell wall biosynthesis
MRPSVAVITPSLPERTALLAECLSSVATQTVQPTEHLIGVDYQRRGPVAIRNELAASTQAEWLAFLDDDDLMYPNHLETLLSQSGDADVVWSLHDVVGREGFWVRHKCDAKKLVDGQPNFILITALVRRSTFVAAGGFPDVPWSEDLALWLRFRALGAGFKCVHKKTWTYRFHDTNRSMT